MSRSGAELALLMLAGFRSLVDAVTAELENRGHQDYRPVFDFALRAIADGADSTSELGRRLAVTKQAAAKTVGILQERGYVTRQSDPLDARVKRLEITALGDEVMREGGKCIDKLRRDWEKKIGRTNVDALEQNLRLLVGDATVRFDTPGWLANDLGTS